DRQARTVAYLSLGYAAAGFGRTAYLNTLADMIGAAAACLAVAARSSRAAGCRHILVAVPGTAEAEAQADNTPAAVHSRIRRDQARCRTPTVVRRTADCKAEAVRNPGAD